MVVVLQVDLVVMEVHSHQTLHAVSLGLLEVVEDFLVMEAGARVLPLLQAPPIPGVVSLLFMEVLGVTVVSGHRTIWTVDLVVVVAGITVVVLVVDTPVVVVDRERLVPVPSGEEVEVGVPIIVVPVSQIQVIQIRRVMEVT
tara:strand:+ start:799 stop:1224 length:426 start_codon:yes stop_codon:yes gene_type:complete